MPPKGKGKGPSKRARPVVPSSSDTDDAPVVYRAEDEGAAAAAAATTPSKPRQLGNYPVRNKNLWSHFDMDPNYVKAKGTHASVGVIPYLVLSCSRWSRQNPLKLLVVPLKTVKLSLL